MSSIPSFKPDAKSPIWKSDRKEELLEIFAHGIKDIAEDRMRLEDLVVQLCEADESLKPIRMTKDVKTALKTFEQITKLTTGISSEEVNAILADESKRNENVSGLRRGAAAIFVQMMKNILQDPKALEDMNPKVVGDWYKIVRQEEDRERELMLKAKAEQREDAKFKLMFFDFISGQLGPQDIEFLNEDLKKDLTALLNANQSQSSRRVLEGAAITSPGTGAQ